MWSWIIAVIVVLSANQQFTEGLFEKFKGSIGCPPMQFLCHDGECITEEKHCNGHPDCVEGEDEHNCDALKCLPPFYHPCDNDHCISSSFLCDGENDCEDWSDEKNCTDFAWANEPCSSTEFECADKLCIPHDWVCDGKNDCLDNSDEPEECYKNITCDGFRCKNHFCIYSEWHCDGSNDCGDNSDEENCPRRDFSLEECSQNHRMFLCHDKLLCIELFEVCNGKQDCVDGSDEGGLCNTTDLCAHANCIHECVLTPTRAECVCPKGTYLEGEVCHDVNECDNYGICDHKCTNLIGSYQCYCDPGFMLGSDKKSCIAEGPEALMVFSSHKQIRAIYLTTEIYYQVAKDLSHVTAVSYDGRHMYWANVFHGEESIMRSLEDGSEQEVIVTAGLGTPEDLALDWMTGNIYFTDSKFQHLGVCSNNGVLCTVLHNQDIDKPRGICLSPVEGLMYWSDWGARPLIARSGMDGSDVVDFITKDIHWPNGLTIDHGNERLYWVDAKLLVIESIKLDGTARRVVLSESIKHPYAVAVFESSIYWSDWTGQEIQKCNKFTGKDRRAVIREKKNRIFGVHIYHPAMMNTSMTNPCQDSGCSDLCLLAPHSRPLRYTCSCPLSKMLAPNGHTCEQLMKNNSVIIGAGSTLIELEHQQLGKFNEKFITLHDVYKVGALAYDALTGNIIISDIAEKKIISLDRESGESITLLSGDVGKVEGMDVDPFGHNVYWADSQRQTVEVLSINTHSRKVLLQDLGDDVPIDVALYPEMGYMYVALRGFHTVHIDRFSMDGDHQTRVHVAESDILGPNVALFFDDHLQSLFWSDSGSGVIVQVDVTSMQQTKVKDVFESPIDIAVVGDDVFWTNHGSSRLLWVNKHDGLSASSKQLMLDLHTGLDSIKLAAVTEKVSGVGHKCHNNNGGCSDICLNGEHQQVCSCPFGMILNRDGKKCEKPDQCPAGFFHCNTGECIPASQRCNHKQDCPQGDDELNCKTITLNCLVGTFSCHDGEKCLESSKRCDGVSDCRDDSDEFDCHQDSCRQEEFQCKSGKCVPSTWRCDGTTDCDDNSDEQDCNQSCHEENQFRCTSGTCINSDWECDGEPDCSDGSDEHDKCEHSCEPDQMRCKNGQCVDQFLVCNGQPDCEDGSDENDCKNIIVEEEIYPTHIDLTETAPTRAKCHDTDFVCDICLPASARCNGTKECLRGEDETNCDGCQSYQFQCQDSGLCIVKEWVCDGSNDCGDNSDEDPSMCQLNKNNTSSNHTYHGNCLQFTCRNKQCASFHQVCDGIPDCEDHSDEGGQCGRGCATAGCMGPCQETPSGPRCFCEPGYKLLGDSKSCGDVDECAVGIFCAQYCHNTPGSFTCSCQYPDYQLRNDHRTCKAKGREMMMVYVLGNEIRYVTASHSKLGVIHASNSPNFQVSGLDVDAHRRCVYWSSVSTGTISRKCSASKATTETISFLVRPGKLALDWLTENIYYIEKGHMVNVCHFGKESCASIVVAAEHVTIDAIALDPLRNLMFWSETTVDVHSKSVIKRADLSGAAIRTITDTRIQQLADLALDSIHQNVYWIDAKQNVIEKMSYQGTDRQTTFSSPEKPVKLALFEHSIYWMAEAQTRARQMHLDEYGNMWKCDLRGPSAWTCDITKIHPRNTQKSPTTFALMHQANQELGRSNCTPSCLHICVGDGICLCDGGDRVKPEEPCPNNSVDNIPRFSTETTQSDKGSSVLWSTFKMVALFLIIVPAVVIVLYVVRYDLMALINSCISYTSKPVLSNIHFNNPAYNVSSSHLETVFHHSRLNPGEHQYENPVAFDNLSDGTDSTITNEIKETKKPKVIEFHVSDFVDDDSGSMEYSEPMGDSHKTPLIR